MPPRTPRSAPPEPPAPTERALEDRAFLWLLLAVSVAFAWILWPFFGAVMWGVVFAILFMPLYRRALARSGGRRNVAALVILLVVILMVILPLIWIGTMLTQEASNVVAKVRSGEISYARYAQQIYEALPGWVTGLLDRFGLSDFAALQERLTKEFGEGGGGKEVANRVLAFGQGTLDFVVSLFVMLYLLYFLLRDGDALMRRMSAAIPLREEQKHALRRKLGIVVRATVKGNVVVAILQGALGGLIFWILGVHAALLWGVLMAVLSLLPAVGTALVWGPVALYFLATGQVTQGLILIAFGVLVIGLVDNVVRPLLVGKDTKMPDWLVLLTTLGGLALFGINGFVLGPLIAAMFIASWDLFAESREPARD